ncbi:MAG: hypothetical protein FWG14_01275 [Peptococcaceae bacterium]|nr:hypothetical protein [Peptococcaceae bacterium]
MLGTRMFLNFNSIFGFSACGLPLARVFRDTNRTSISSYDEDSKLDDWLIGVGH